MSSELQLIHSLFECILMPSCSACKFVSKGEMERIVCKCKGIYLKQKYTMRMTVRCQWPKGRARINECVNQRAYNQQAQVDLMD